MNAPVANVEHNGGSGKADALDVIVASGAAEMRERWGGGLREKFVVYEAAERAALEHLMTMCNPCILVLDLTLPGLGGVEGLPHMQQLSPLHQDHRA